MNMFNCCWKYFCHNFHIFSSEIFFSVHGFYFLWLMVVYKILLYFWQLLASIYFNLNHTSKCLYLAAREKVFLPGSYLIFINLKASPAWVQVLWEVIQVTVKVQVVKSTLTCCLPLFCNKCNASITWKLSWKKVMETTTKMFVVNWW